jgi:hypothetical protein
VFLFAVPAFLVSGIVAASLLAASAGALWLFVFGDNPWPPSAGNLLGAIFVLSGAVLWLALLSVAYTVGKQQEARPALNRRHVALSLGATMVLGALVAVRVMGLNTLGARSDSLVCADFCRAEGFAASGTSPRNAGDQICSCYDSQGQETRHLPLSEVATGKP